MTTTNVDLMKVAQTNNSGNSRRPPWFDTVIADFTSGVSRMSAAGSTWVEFAAVGAIEVAPELASLAVSPRSSGRFVVV